MGKMIKPGLFLLLVTVIAAVVLAFVFRVTAAPIAEQEKLAKETAMKAVLPTADSFNTLETKDETITTCAEGITGSDVSGYVVGTYTKGYSGDVNVMVGFDLDGAITGVEIVSQTETPGLGANCVNPEFRDQYIGDTVENVVVKAPPKEDSEIEAMTSSTITSKAVTLAVNNARTYYESNLKGGN